MKKFLIFFFLIAVNVDAQTNLHTCLEYMTTNYPTSIWMLQDDGQGAYIKQWSSPLAKPTLVQAYSNWPACSIWKSNAVAEAKSDVANWKTQQVDGETLADAFRALIICINRRLPAGTNITAAEFKTELKTQLQQ